MRNVKASSKQPFDSCKLCSAYKLCLGYTLCADVQKEFSSIIARRVNLKQNQKLYMPGMRFQFVYIIQSGSIKTQVLSCDGSEQITGFHFAGELLGIDGLANGAHVHSVEALEPSRVCKIPFKSLKNVLTKHEPTCNRFLSMISQQLIDDQSMLLTLNQLTAEQRIAKFLLKLSNKLGSGNGLSKEFRFSMSRYDIANYLGLAVETVSRTISRFRREGSIAIRQRRVRIVDRNKLAACINAS